MRLPRNEAYVAPDGHRGLLRADEESIVCRSHYKFLVGMYPGAQDLVDVVAARRKR